MEKVILESDLHSATGCCNIALYMTKEMTVETLLNIPQSKVFSHSMHKFNDLKSIISILKYFQLLFRSLIHWSLKKL
jgi:succinate dehydrogenase/fumarate reductase cytochrome b subunit